MLLKYESRCAHNMYCSNKYIVIIIFSIMSNEFSWCIVNVRTIIVISDLSRNPIYFGKGQWQWETFRDKCSRLVERGSGELPEQDTCLQEAWNPFLKTTWTEFRVGTFLHISNGKSMIAVQNPLEMRLGRKLTECTQCLCNELCSVFFYARCA